ncbi:hypothetical protein [Clostridium paraputrificum]|uniref:hypothetical protein n=1 Tax=Clostridium paraputrificum TaxID=29363 RepID=UPI00374EA723
MHFIELLLGLSVFTFIFSLIPLLYIKNNKIKDWVLTISAISIILIAMFLYLYICNALMTCITIWFGNW